MNEHDEMIKRLCASGAFAPFVSLCEEILSKEPGITFHSDSHKLAYEHGVYDGMKRFVGFLKNEIDFRAGR